MYTLISKFTVFSKTEKKTSNADALHLKVSNIPCYFSFWSTDALKNKKKSTLTEVGCLRKTASAICVYTSDPLFIWFADQFTNATH